MRGWLSLVGAFMLAVMLWTGSTAHAAEVLGCIEVNADSIGQEEGKPDPAPAAPDKGVPHHHGGCHSHHVAVPDGDAAKMPAAMAASPIGAAADAMVAGGEPGTALRPPIA